MDITLSLCINLFKNINMTPEKSERVKQNRHKHSKNTTLRQKEQKGEQNARKYFKKLKPIQTERLNKTTTEYVKNRTAIRKQPKNQTHRGCLKTLTAEQKDRKNERAREYFKKFTPNQRERLNERARKYVKNWTAVQKQRKLHRDREYRKNWTVEKKQHNNEMRKQRRQKKHERRKNTTPEQRERRNQLGHEYRKNLTPEQRETLKRQKREWYERSKQKRELEKSKAQNVPGADQNNKDQQLFCKKCRAPFSNNTSLLRHIYMHVTQPFVVMSRIDEYKNSLPNIKLEIQNSLHDNNIPAVNIKLEKCDSFKKEETEIIFDEPWFEVHIKRELETDEKVLRFKA